MPAGAESDYVRGLAKVTAQVGLKGDHQRMRTGHCSQRDTSMYSLTSESLLGPVRDVRSELLLSMDGVTVPAGIRA